MDQSRQPEAFGPADNGEPPSLLIHAVLALRGRYRLTIALAILAASLGAVFGWLREAPIYQSNGMIRVTPLMQRILYTSQTEKNAPPPAPGIFEAFVQSQVSIIRSQQLIDRVLQSDDWAALGEAHDEQAVARFWTRLEVHHPPRTELIRVSFRHPNPEVATQAVRLVIQTYRMLQGRQSTEERIQALVKNEVQLTEDLAEIRKAITEITSRHGTTDLTRLFNMQMMALSEIESTFRSTRMDLIMAESSVADLDDVSHLNEEEVARFDPLMMSYIQKREQLESDLVLWRARYTDEMPGRTQIESEYADTQRRIEARLREVASSGQLALAGRSGGSGSVGPRALDVLRERAQRVRELYDRDRKVTLQIGMDDLRVKTLTSEADLVQGRLEEVKGRIDQLRVESSVIGKINVISEGDRPLTPIADRRRAMALAGSLGGAGLAVASIIGWGLLERRIRYSDEVSRHIGIPLFGVVPEIDTDSTQAYPTESVVREIRWALELRGQEHSQGLQTVAVIGDSTNGGVSSISLALGVSFAASGRSTALLDLGAGEARLRSILASNEEPAPDDDTAALLELPTGIRNLTLVDPRNATEVDDLPLARIQNLLDELRERFDVILIDCGSLDSSQGFLPACSIADGSLLVCARGVKTASIEKAVARLRGCRARILGAVFNRACPDDLPPHARSSAPVQSELRDKNLHRLGPIVATMVHGQHVENQ